MRALIKPIHIVLLAAAALLLAILFFAWMTTGKAESIVGMVGGEAVPVAAPQAGTVEHVAVAPGQTVAPGDVLLTLDAAHLRAQVDSIRAELESLSMLSPAQGELAVREIARAGAARRLELARNAEDTARAVVERLSVELAQARLERRRAALNSAEPNAMEAAAAREQTLLAAQEEAQQQLFQASRLRADLAAGREPDFQNFQAEQDTAAENAPLAQLERQLAEQLRRAEESLAAATLITPYAGIVRSVDVKPGDVLPEGFTALWLEPADSALLWVNALFEEKDIVRLQPGMQATIRQTDDSDEKSLEWKGYVEAVSGADGPKQTTEQAPEQATGQADDQAEALPAGQARIRFEAEQPSGLALPRLGETVQATVECRMPRRELQQEREEGE